MLTTYVKTLPPWSTTARDLPAPHLDALIVSLEACGDPPRRMLHLIRGVQCFSRWAQDAGLTLPELDANAWEAFAAALAKPPASALPQWPL